MEKRDVLLKALAIVGTVLVWLPIFAPILFSMPRYLRSSRFQVDYLMPAELFPIVLVGGGLLIWVTLRARSQRALTIIGGLAASIVFLVAGQALAVATGLASGETEPTGFWWALVVASVALYTAGIVAMGVGGAMIVRDLFKMRQPPALEG